jgi:hypothetical protein
MAAVAEAAVVEVTYRSVEEDDTTVAPITCILSTRIYCVRMAAETLSAHGCSDRRYGAKHSIGSTNHNLWANRVDLCRIMACRSDKYIWRRAIPDV